MASTSELQLIISAKDEASKALGSVGSSISKIAKVSAVAFTAAAGALAVYAKKSIDAYNEEAQVAKKLQTIVLNQKKNTMENVEALKAQAAAMQKVGVFGDEVVMAAQAQLATFDLQGKSIEKVIPGLLDMLAAEKGLTAGMDDAKQMAQGLGKAFNGQFDVLKKQGFVITEAQEKMIEFGDEAMKTKAITEILGTTYKGMNAALRDTFQGQMVAAKMVLGDFMEMTGKFLVDQLTPIVTKFNEWSASMGGAQGMFDALVAKFNEMKIAVKAWRESFFADTNYIWVFLKDFFMPIIELLRTTFVQAWTDINAAIEPIKPQLLIVAKFFGVILLGAIMAVIAILASLIVAATKLVAFIVTVFSKTILYLTDMFTNLWLRISAVIDLVTSLSAAWNKLKTTLNQPINAIVKLFKKDDGGDGKALGGSVTRGQSYVVGEHRPEVFVPSQSGSIKQLNQVGMGRDVTVNFNNVSVRSDDDLEYIVNAVKKTLGREQELTRMGA